ncbi:MAG: hypothetical protein LBR10_15140 [Prevotellaceae bacterium]|jgi:hypothetical protein|nr:hypothetical protein [Prevotellaceae bacterium]
MNTKNNNPKRIEKNREEGEVLENNSTTFEKIQELRDILKIMERSVTCVSLSGLGGIFAGVCALVGASFAGYWLYFDNNVPPAVLQHKLWLLAAATFVGAFLCVSLFSYLRSKKLQVPFWSSVTRRLITHIALPFIAGSFIILWGLNQQLYILLLPASLIIYGIAVFCGSRYSTDEARYLGMVEMFLGCVAIWLPACCGLLLWAVGFGVMHIVYGSFVWYRYERKK